MPIKELVGKIETSFGVEMQQRAKLNEICDTIYAKQQNAKFCHEYFCRFTRGQCNEVRTALYNHNRNSGIDLTDYKFEYNLFNRNILRCVFYSLIGNNTSRIDNLEELLLTLFPKELSDYENKRKSFSIRKLCIKYPNAKIVIDVEGAMKSAKWFEKIITLRNQITHSAINGILSNDPLTDDEHDYFVYPEFTLSGKRESVMDFSKNLNDLLDKIESKLLNSLIDHGQNSLNDYL